MCAILGFILRLELLVLAAAMFNPFFVPHVDQAGAMLTQCLPRADRRVRQTLSKGLP